MDNVFGKALAEIRDFSNDERFGPHGGFTAIASTETKDRDGENVYANEWELPLPDHITIDADHGMSLATTIGSAHPYLNETGELMIDAKFSSIARAQEARALVTEGHIKTVSVAFLRHKNEKAGTTKRELLNVGLVAIPANPEAQILESKALDVRAEEVAEERLETKAPKPYGNVTYADPEDGKYPVDTIAHIRAALAYINVQRNYDALGDHAAHVKRAIEAAARAHGIDVSDSKALEGAELETKAEKEPPSVTVRIVPKLDEDALKNVMGEIFTKAGTAAGTGNGALVQAIHDAAGHLGAVCVMEPADDTDSGASSGANKSATETEVATKDLEAFDKSLDEVLTPTDSPDDAPAEAASASDEEPEPADDAAAKSADDMAIRMGALRMQVAARTRLLSGK